MTHTPAITPAPRPRPSISSAAAGGDPAATELLALRDLAEAIATEVGELVRAMRTLDVAVAATKSTATDVVTRADLAAEQRVAELLAQHRPQDGLMGEEGTARPSASGITWVVDPIDGTVNYLYGRPDYAVSLAAVLGPADDVERWRPLAGAVRAPELGVTYRAARGLGAERNGVSLRRREAPELGLALLSTGLSYEPGVRAQQGEMIAALVPRVRDVRRVGAGALDVCDVASGRLDAHLERGLNPWDVAAAELVAAEAGVAVHVYPLGADGRRVTLVAPAPLDAAIAAVAAPWLA